MDIHTCGIGRWIEDYNENLGYGHLADYTPDEVYTGNSLSSDQARDSERPKGSLKEQRFHRIFVANLSHKVGPAINVYFAGRLGEYKYYDMEKAVERGFSVVTSINDPLE